jgi:hypothetical protein
MGKPKASLPPSSVPDLKSYKKGLLNEIAMEE